MTLKNNGEAETAIKMYKKVKNVSVKYYYRNSANNNVMTFQVAGPRYRGPTRPVLNFWGLGGRS